MASRLKEKYQKEVVPALQKEFSYTNPMQVPTIHKVVVNIGMGEAIQNAKAIDKALARLAEELGSGQPAIRKDDFAGCARPQPKLVFFLARTKTGSILFKDER